jgi:hypothetical protein
MFRYLPWRFIVRRAARAYGVADPLAWLARIRSFARPSEVAEPIELLRAGILFHARGMVNTRAIQHNLDWIWPYWAQRQFDPKDVSFIPRGFAISHVNLTHRNWTAIGLPELSIYPIVDPRGLVTPIQDGWSIDFWLLDADGKMLVPSRLPDEAVVQKLEMNERLAVVTTARLGERTLRQAAFVELVDREPAVTIDVEASSPGGGALVVAIRPYNPEGVQFVDCIAALSPQDGFRINDRLDVLIDRKADRLLASDYDGGDVFSLLSGAQRDTQDSGEWHDVRCKVGMATGAAVYRFQEDQTRLKVRVPLERELELLGNKQEFDPAMTWQRIRAETAALRVPDERLQFLYDAAVHTLVLLSADEIVPGPYTYRRFWFRDACIMMNALLTIGLTSHCRRAIERFPQRQLRDGYFRSQEGEWDSNGQVLWILDRYELLTGEPLSEMTLKSVAKAVQWIDRKRIRDDNDPLHSGLLPAGFSAEHLGPNDHYYWDDFWAEAGLRAAERIYSRLGRRRDAEDARAKADDLRRAIDRSLSRIPASRSLAGIPASPYRRIDSGAIGSLVADFPLQLYPPGAPQIMATVEALLRRCFLHGGFFQDVIHSGINAYLTLDVAQTLLRAGDERFRDLIEAVARLASPTGQWPEAIHPHTLGGCMGDGQHGWAAAEMVMMLRNCFVREETDGSGTAGPVHDRLIVGSGLFAEWFEVDEDLLCGPTLTPWGRVTIRIARPATEPTLIIDARWHAQPPRVDVEIPGFRPLKSIDCSRSLVLARDDAGLIHRPAGMLAEGLPS